MPYGTLITLDTLAASQQSIVTIGEDRIFEALQLDLAAHNILASEKFADLVEFSTDRRKRYGGTEDMEMEDLDEFGTPEAQKVTAGVTVDFPLWRVGIGLQWTRHWFKNHVASELAAQYTAIRNADTRRIDLEIRRAFFLPTNYSTQDKLVDWADLDIVRLANADGMPVPNDPYGNSFDGATHTHYLANNGISDTVVQNAVDTVAEHYATGSIYIYINRAQESWFTATSSKFTPYIPTQIIPATTADRARGTLVTNTLYNRAIGIYGDQAAEVWVKPWIPANYLLVLIKGVRKPLVWRTREGGEGNLELEYDDEVHPLRAQALAREFGIGVWERTAASVLYVGGGAYTAPSLS